MTSDSQHRTVLQRLPQGARVAVVRLRSLGDCVLTTPALKLLKRERPDLEIGVVVEQRFAAVFEGNPAVSAILAPELGVIRRWHPALCLNLHGGRPSQLLTLASGAQIRAGFAHHSGAAIYRVKIPRAQEILGEERPVHTAEHLASAMFYLGVPIGEIPRASLFAERHAAERPYAVIHSTAAAAYKTWPAERFLAVAEHLQRTHALEPVFIGSGDDDLTLFHKYRRIAGAPLRDVMSLLAGASLFVGNDSGPAHMAAALGIPVVVLFGRLEHQVTWAPWKAVAARTLTASEGISGITAKQAIEAIGELLRRATNRD
ncbi:MAG TPA: glycosyltransferase family 9 protein [Bryobacteraceae bacterium]|nr:glycosyltransferase family 9 protein [Bryobacteraceae bacterium]